MRDATRYDQSLKAVKYITNEIKVWHRYRIELGDNGASADAWVGCYVAPDTGRMAEWVYLETNGDPVLIGALDEDGELELSEDFPQEALEPWLVETLEAELMIAPASEERIASAKPAGGER